MLFTKGHFGRPVKWLWLLLALPLVSAAEGPGVVVLVHHPDDGVDPLGLPFAGVDSFTARHGHIPRFTDGVAYPGFVADGFAAFEGLAEGEDPLQATLAVYNGAVTMRSGVSTPLSFDLWVDETVRLNITSQTDLRGEALRLWTAIVEDPVHYEPPPGLTNGVFDHPFTVRSITNHGPVELPQGVSAHVLEQDLQPSWDLNRLWVAAWIEQTGVEGRFDPHEVVQATMHRWTAQEPTQQHGRGVLVEAYSATWCEPCLIGDLAIERLADMHGLSPGRAAPAPDSYYQPPHAIVFLFAAAAFAFVALVRLR